MTSSRPALSFGRKYCRTTPPDPTRSDLRCHDRSTRVPVISYRPLQIFCRAGPQIVATVELLRWEDAIQRLGHAQCFFTGSMGRSHEQYGNCLTDPAMTPYFKQCRYKYDTHRDGDFACFSPPIYLTVCCNQSEHTVSPPSTPRFYRENRSLTVAFFAFGPWWEFLPSGGRSFLAFGQYSFGGSPGLCYR